jgi:hypothetical protein
MASDTYSVLVVPDVALDGRDPHAGNIDIPPIQVVALRLRGNQTSVDGIAVNNLEFGEPDALLETRRGRDARYHHQLDQLLRLDSQLSSFRHL